MKIYGYPTQHDESEDLSPTELSEITLSASPAELRQIGAFLVACAAEMERMGDSYDHVHLGDRMKKFDSTSPHFVVVRASPTDTQAIA